MMLGVSDHSKSTLAFACSGPTNMSILRSLRN
jgi:hypothetical protein